MHPSWKTFGLVLILAFAPIRIAHSADTSFVVVVNSGNDVGEIEAKRLSDIFLKRVAFWPSKTVIQPVDQKIGTEVREAFSEQILKRPVVAVRNYWQQLIFSGRGIPPPELKNDADVVGFILANPNAIGYVSASADLRGLKIVKIR